MKRSLLAGACLAALSATSASAMTISDIGEIHIDAAHCLIGSGGMQFEGGGQLELEAYLSNLAAMREESVAAALATGGITNDGSGDDDDDSDSDSDSDDDDETQVVYLEFNPGEPTFPVILVLDGQAVGSLVFDDYIYTQEDRDLIQSRLEADYQLYDYEFTQVQPASGEFSTLTFGDNDGGNIALNIVTGGVSILFGRAENIDFRNNNRSDNAFIDGSFWRFVAELDRANGTSNLQNFSGIPVEKASDIDLVERLAVVNQSSNTGSHELGHIQGLRHHDSIGAPGDGLPPGVDPFDYLPLGETDQNAFETILHTMASGASVGLPLTGSTIEDRFFAERSAVKMAVNADIEDRVRKESKVRGKLKLAGLDTPNPLEAGVNAGLELKTKASLIAGRLDVIDEVDSYKFKGKAGQVFNAEVISFSDVDFAEPIIGLLVLSQKMNDGSLVELTRNRLTFEGIEPMIIDFELPEKGDYVLQVSSPSTIDFGGGLVFPLSLFGLGGFEVGDYDLHAYIVEGEADDDDDSDSD